MIHIWFLSLSKVWKDEIEGKGNIEAISSVPDLTRI